MPGFSRRVAMSGGMASLVASAPGHAAVHAPPTAAFSAPDDMTLGSSKAAVTVVEYASVACPVCGRWYKEVYPGFKAKYIDTGRVHFVLREMLVGDQQEVAIAASGFLLARCAGPKNYFAVIDAIFESQPGLFGMPQPVLLAIAQNAGFTPAQFEACIGDQAALDALSRRVAANVQRDAVAATPTFVINGRSLSAGYRTLAELDAAIARVGSA